MRSMTAAWLLPVVTLTVAASSGGVLARTLQLYSPTHALISIIVSISLVTIGLTLALMIITIYLQRLIVHGLPPGKKILSVFLPLGPTAQSGFAFLLIGQNCKTLLPLGSSDSDFWTSAYVGEIIYVMCVSVAFLLWSLAVMCIVFALLGIYDTLRQTRIPFGLTFWGLVFPNAVFANLTINLSNTFDSPFLRIIGAIYAVVTFIVWIYVACRTVLVVYDRTIFENELDEDHKPLSSAPASIVA
ncbi:hypothetical protein H0H92_001954 [Tricholoma furcatifolium]|nr:hypothetical protein H0H92_001954 [Tricholoma furcatifolium]